ncbi:Rz1-like lysis system protein LysC [Sodalis ligni]|uniref:Rz1-like lysis system protein LysC n=1 Tax=Sodalis ligni TaxID=2697027 RepID=UPI001FB59543|nr:Rz1-like lysis system protein LysC [Sodalis ligni]
MKISHYVIGPTALCLMLSAGCTNAPPSTAPQITYAGCPRITSCPIPASRPKTHGDLSTDIRRLEAALIACDLQVDAIKQCQELQNAET